MNLIIGDDFIERTCISKEQMRKFLVYYQGLNTPKPFKGHAGIKDFVKRVGCLQYDPLNVVGRNIDLILQSRLDNYEPYMLDKLMYQDREIIDGWDKMMSIYCIEDWAYFLRIRNKRKTEIEGILERRNSSDAISYVDTVRKYISNNGACLPSKIDLGGTKSGKWGHVKYSSAVMDYMFNMGMLGVKMKINVQRVYDLIENILPKEIMEMNDPFDSDRSFYKWYFKRRIGSIGLYWNRNGGGWLGHVVSDKRLRSEILRDLCAERELIRVEVEGVPENFYIRTEDSHMLADMEQNFEKKVTFLAPLDNLLWDRKLVKDIFNFEYSWEVYIPASKRKFGYYVLPVLYGDQIIARFEPEVHRGDKPLIIKNWWWEDKIVVTDEVIHEIMECFTRFCGFLKSSGLSDSSYDAIFGK
ncbi:DNA glycosylase AlkZ-like family protein [Paenibacillus sp. FSL R5-0345]|uniref:DNA glycosylase AlkZ-like family protein n=1 Tax=Paenibacillus sp. FSL R5-0345 TaxID=1536770 RepID=UPI000A725FC3|nr:crosslink repair DNA glycosylase YcaQ family protein [Paenibacillus sp. FSL R5-0345]